MSLRKIIDLRDHQLDCYNDWVNDEEAIEKAHKMKATHALFDNGELVCLEIGVWSSGRKYVCLGETEQEYGITYA
jgi:hypothetical protein